jgi:transposase
VEAIRVLRVARSSARHDRTEALNQMHSLVCTAPDELREQLRDLSIFRLVELAAAFRPGEDMTVANATKTALRETRPSGPLPGRADEAAQQAPGAPGQGHRPALVAAFGVGTDTAGALLVTAGDNPDRLRNEAAFAHLCGSSPIEASSGKVTRHRLNRGGDRSANHALWRIVMVRMQYDADTRAYVERRTKEGKSKREITRIKGRLRLRPTSGTRQKPRARSSLGIYLFGPK